MRTMQVVGLVLTIASSIFSIAWPLHQGRSTGPIGVATDGEYVIHVKAFGKTRNVVRALGSMRPEGRLWRLSVVIENRGRVASAAAPRFSVVAGEYEFPAVASRGRAFDYLILPEGSARGVLWFDVLDGVVPETIEADVDGNGSHVVIELSSLNAPP